MSIDDKTDSNELQALFDSIAGASREETAIPEAMIVSTPEAAATETPVAAPVASSAVYVEEAGEASDDELQVLFDTVYAHEHHSDQPTANENSAVSENQQVFSSLEHPAEEPKDMFQQVGQMTRRLHQMLHELGYDDVLHKAAATTIPNTKARLQYITDMTEQAAEKVLAATEVASPLVETIATESKQLHERWSSVFQSQVSADVFRQLALDTKEYLEKTQERSDIARAQLLDIMMAQDFQDLTGQVIKKVIDLAQELESHLLLFLIDNIPTEKRGEAEGLINGPVIDSSRDDIVTNQIQVDDLLESLGF